MNILFVGPNSTSSPRYMKAVNCEMRAACCMLWVTMTMVNSVAQLLDQLLDLAGRDRIERRGRLVEKDDLGVLRDGARDAQALLLAARQAHARTGAACP